MKSKKCFNERMFLVCIFSLGLFALVSGTSEVFDITSYGAKGDGKTLNTKAIQLAIDAANKNGGGRVVVPAGRFLTGTVMLKSGVDLHLIQGATLLGSTNYYDYKRNHSFMGIIIATNQNNIAVSGEGVINGQGNKVVLSVIHLMKKGKLSDQYRLNRPSECFRPSLVELYRCKNVKITGVTMEDAACWVSVYDQCNELVIDGVKIRSMVFWNNDGIDIVDCKNVKITNCDVNSSDDGICLKSHDAKSYCSNIYIANCKVRSSASALKFGTASHGGFRNVTIRNLDVYDTYRSAIALEAVDGGFLDSVDISGVTARNTGNAIFIRLGHRNKTDRYSSVKNVYISGVNVDIPNDVPDKGYPLEGPPDIHTTHNLVPGVVISGIPGFQIQNVTLENITINFGGGADHELGNIPVEKLETVPENINNYPEFTMFDELPSWGLYMRHVNGLNLKNISLKLMNNDFRPALVFDDVSSLTVSGLSLPSDEQKDIVLKKTKAVFSGVKADQIRRIDEGSSVVIQ